MGGIEGCMHHIPGASSTENSNGIFQRSIDPHVLEDSAVLNAKRRVLGFQVLLARLAASSSSQHIISPSLQMPLVEISLLVYCGTEDYLRYKFLGAWKSSKAGAGNQKDNKIAPSEQ